MVKDAVKITARELAPELDKLITGAIEIGDPEDVKALVDMLWDNKVGILRVLQAVAAE